MKVKQRRVAHVDIEGAKSKREKGISNSQASAEFNMKGWTELAF